MIKLPSELRAALARHQGGPIEFSDDETKRVYVLIEAGGLMSLSESAIEVDVREGLEAIDRGEVGIRDPDEIKREGRRRLDSIE